MIFENFKIENGCCVLFNNENYDLHNDFKFTGFRYEVESAELELGWYSLKQPYGLAILFKSVSFLKMKEKSTKELVNDKIDFLDFIGFLHPDDINEMSASLHVLDAKEDSHLIFRMESGQAIKVYSKSVIAKLW